MSKTPQLHPKQGIPVSYLNPPLSPYLGALEVIFVFYPFYKFVPLSLMVLYQLESLHLDDYNLIYSQNKNRGFDIILTAFPLKTKHFSFYNHSSKPIQTNTNQQYSSKLNPTQPQNSFTTKTKLFLSTFGVFPNSNTNKRGLGFESYLKSLTNFNTKVLLCFFITLAFDFHGAIHKSLHSKTLALSIFLKNENALMRGMSLKGQIWSLCLLFTRPCLAFTLNLIFSFFPF